MIELIADLNEQNARIDFEPIAARRLKEGLFQIGEGFRTFHTFKRLRGRPGLVQRNRVAGLAGASKTVVAGQTIDDLEAVVFIGPPASKYARIQEKGTVGAGGSMPDIIPKRAKALRFEIDGEVFFSKRVAIPPRLEWFKTWDEYVEAGHVRNALSKIRARIIKDIAAS